MSTRSAYSNTQVTLHWLTAIGVLVAFFSHDRMKNIAHEVWRASASPYPTIHTAAGSAVFLLVLARLWIRRKHGAPEPEGTGGAQMAAVWGHRLLYALLIAIPLMGALTWFGGVRGLAQIHGITGKVLMATALGHAVMAIYHHYGKKDGTLRRMVPMFK